MEGVALNRIKNPQNLLLQNMQKMRRPPTFDNETHANAWKQEETDPDNWWDQIKQVRKRAMTNFKTYLNLAT